MNYTNDEKDALIKDLCACEQKYLARIADQDDRIAELTAELEAVNERAYSTCEGLTAEVTRMREAMKKIQRLNNWDNKTAAGNKIAETYFIARTALKEDK